MSDIVDDIFRIPTDQNVRDALRRSGWHDVRIDDYFRTKDRPPLFRRGAFTSHSGRELSVKVECDALTDEDWEGVAQLLAERLPRFGRVEGIPRGGLKLAAALRQYRCEGHPCLLFVDDVLTTGASMEEARKSCPAGVPVLGAVFVARGTCPPWVFPLLRMGE